MRRDHRAAGVQRSVSQRRHRGGDAARHRGHADISVRTIGEQCAALKTLSNQEQLQRNQKSFPAVHVCQDPGFCFSIVSVSTCNNIENKNP